MKQKIILLLAAILMTGAVATNAKKVHTLGDSTMAWYDESKDARRGWGMYFGQFLTNGWTSINYAKGGRDSRQGYTELWQAAKSKVEAGDYVIIQFAHNDEKINGVDRDALYKYYMDNGKTSEAAALDSRGTTPSTTYKEWLTKIIDEVVAKGATPILVSPVCRCYFSGNTIRRNGRHDLGDSYQVLTETGLKSGTALPANDHTMDYVYHMAQLAQEKSVPYIDLTTATKTLYENAGSSKCHDMYFAPDDNTHYNTTGAMMAARLCAQLMKAQGILADNIVVPEDLTVTPDDGNFGEAYMGQSLTKEFTLNGFGLKPEQGSVTIEGQGVQLSLDKKTWSASISTDYTAGMIVKTFYAQLTLENEGTTQGTIVVKQGEKTITIPVKATAVKMEGGQPVKAFWPLLTNDEFVAEGPITVLGQSMSKMTVQGYAPLKSGATTWPDGATDDTNRKTQRNVVEGGNWKAEIDDDPERYIDFAVKPNKGTDLKINNISMYVGGAGGNGMMCHIYYSTDGFVTRQTIYAPKNMVSNTMNEVKVQPVLTVPNGKELHVRIYPWYSSDATGKTICLADVTISGMAVEADPAGIKVIDNGQLIIDNSAVYYTLDGKRLSQPARGINLVRMSDGTFKKMMY